MYVIIGEQSYKGYHRPERDLVDEDDAFDEEAYFRMQQRREQRYLEDDANWDE